MLVTLFKSTSSGSGDTNDNKDDKFIQALRQANFTAQIIPVVAFEFCSLDILWRELQHPQHYDGLIFTSPRCVESLKRAVETLDSQSEWTDSLRDCWIHKPMYSVGPSTKDAIIALFGHNSSQQNNIFVSEKGNSESLAHKILEESQQRHPINLPLLYPCGSLKTDTLGSILTKENIPWKAVTVYDTVKNPELERILLEKAAGAEQMEQDEVYVFFSPSGLRYSLPHLKELEKKKFVALGPTTRQALESTPSVPSANIYQCELPTPEALITLLNSLLA